jgi:hypothetical protein
VPSATPVLPTATNTPVVAPAATRPTATSTTVPDAKATLSAQQTQLAAGKFTTTVIATSTAFSTGFADQVGLPGLLGLGAALI